MTVTTGWQGVLLAAGQVMALGALYAFSVLIQPLQQQFAATRTETGLVFSISTAIFTMAVMVAPRLYFRWGGSHIVTATCFAGMLGLAAAALAPTFVIFLIAYAGLFAAASGIGYSAALYVALSSSVTRPGLATGAVVAGFALGAVVFGPAMAQMDASVSLRAAISLPMLVLGGMGLLGLVFGRHVRPVVSPNTAAAAAAKNCRREMPGDTRLLCVLWCGFATGAAGGLMVLGHAAGIVADEGGSAMFAGMAVSSIAIGNAVGRLSGGAISDHLGICRVLIVAGLTMGFSIGLVSLSFGLAANFLAFTGVGLSYGMMASGYPIAVFRSFGSARFGAVYGRVFTAWGMAGLGAPLAAGWIFDRSGSYDIALRLAAVCAFLSALIASNIPDRRI